MSGWNVNYEAGSEPVDAFFSGDPCRMIMIDESVKALVYSLIS
jgi:hypothetical protein